MKRKIHLMFLLVTCGVMGVLSGCGMLFAPVPENLWENGTMEYIGLADMPQPNENFQVSCQTSEEDDIDSVTGEKYTEHKWKISFSDLPYENYLDELDAYRADRCEPLYDENCQELEETDKALTEAEKLGKEKRLLLQKTEQECIRIEEQYTDKIVILQNALPVYQEVEELKRQKQQIEKEIDKNKEQERELAEREEKLEAKRAEAAGIIESCAEAGIRADAAEREKSDLQRRRERLETLERKEQDLRKKEEICRRKKKEWEEKRSAYLRCHEEYEGKYQAFLDGQAGFLARNLEEGAPCPVCGSLHHPLPCSLPEEFPSEADVDRAKRKRDQAEEVRNQYADDYQREASEFGTLQKILREEYEQEFQTEVGEDAGERIRQELEQGKIQEERVQEKLKRALEEKERFQQAQELEKSLMSRLESLKEESDSLRQKQQLKELKRKELETALFTKRQGLPAEDAEEAGQRLRTMQQAVSCAKEARTRAEEEYQKIMEKQNHLSGQKERLEKSCRQNKAERDRQKAEYEKTLKEQGFSDETSYREALIDEDKLHYPMVLRRWKEGDSFQPFGMEGHKKVSDYLIDAKVSLPDKRRQFVLVSGGQIVWLVGRRVDERFRIDASTENVLKLTREADSML